LQRLRSGQPKRQVTVGAVRKVDLDQSGASIGSRSSEEQMTHVQEILVPVDFSMCSADVVRRAADVAWRYEAKLLLLHVVAPILGMDMDDCIELGGEGSPLRRASVTGHLRRFAQDQFPALSAVALECGVPCSISTEQGGVTDTIIEVAERRGVGMIVMGTHGRRGPAHALQGSIAESVVRRASCPVMTFRFQMKPECEECCMWCISGVTELRDAIKTRDER